MPAEAVVSEELPQSTAIDVHAHTQVQTVHGAHFYTAVVPARERAQRVQTLGRAHARHVGSVSARMVPPTSTCTELCVVQRAIVLRGKALMAHERRVIGSQAEGPFVELPVAACVPRHPPANCDPAFCRLPSSSGLPIQSTSGHRPVARTWRPERARATRKCLLQPAPMHANSIP